MTRQMWFAVPFLLALVAADDVSVGCYDSVDTSVSRGFNQYQTLSLCASECGDEYAYVAVMNGGYCYCLLSLPSGLTSNSCNVKCNGYGSVMCGGSSSYSVFKGLGNAANAQSGLASPSDAKSSGSGSASAEDQNSDTASSPNTSNTSSSTVVASSASITTSGSSSTSKSSSTASPTPTTSSLISSSLLLLRDSTITVAPSLLDIDVSTKVVTTQYSSENGSVIYRTITTQVSATASAEPKSGGGGSKSKTGPIVGGVVGGVAGVVLVAVALFFFLRRRNSDDDDEEGFYEKGGSISKKNKFNSGLDMPMTNPFAHPTDEFADKRMSKMTQNGLTDPRLNPVMVGRRRLSEGSLADETDYSRKILGVANP